MLELNLKVKSFILSQQLTMFKYLLYIGSMIVSNVCWGGCPNFWHENHLLPDTTCGGGWRVSSRIFQKPVSGHVLQPFSDRQPPGNSAVPRPFHYFNYVIRQRMREA